MNGQKGKKEGLVGMEEWINKWTIEPWMNEWLEIKKKNAGKCNKVNVLKNWQG